MASPRSGRTSLLLGLAGLAGLAVGQNCYYAPGSKYVVPSEVNLLPCDADAPFSTCCFAGDICLTGNACYDSNTGNTYQYGCTDITYKDDSCPFKCGWSPDHSPWVALENCANEGLKDTWVCQSPESCGCLWRSTYSLAHLPDRSCKDMGHLARVAVVGAENLAGYASLPGKAGGSTGYFPKTATTVVNGYTPASFGPTTSYDVPRTISQLYPGLAPAPSAGSALVSGVLPPIPTTGVLAETSSFPPEILAGSTGLGGGGGGGGGSPTSTSGAAGSPTGGSGSGSGSGSGGSGGGLTTGAKVGLGVGIAGGVCLLAAIVLVAVVMRRRKKPTKAATQDPDYVQGYNDKSHDSYQSYTSAPPESTAAYYDPHQRATPSPGLYEAPYTPTEEQLARKRMSPQGPQELDNSSERHELESNTTGTPGATPVVGSHSRSTSGVK